MKLRTQLILWISILVVIPISIFTFYLSKYSLEEIRAEEIESLSVDNEQAFFQLRVFVDKYVDQTLALTGVPPIGGLDRTKDGAIDPVDGSTNELWLERLGQIFESFASSDKYVDHIRLFDIDGNELVRVNRLLDGQVSRVAEPQLQNKSDREYYLEGITERKGEVYVSALDLNIENGEIEIPYKPVLRFASPTYVDGKLTGLIVINIKMRSLLDLLSLDRRLTITDQDGFYIHNSLNNSEFTKQLQPSENLFNEVIYDERLNNEDGSGYFYKEDDGVHVFWSRVVLDTNHDNSLLVVSRATEEEVIAPVIRLVGRIYYFAGVLILISIIISYFVAKRVTDPIEKLKQKAVTYKKGALSEVGASSVGNASREIIELDNAVTVMAKELLKTKATLQGRVEEQTEKIEESLEKTKEKNIELENIQKAMMNLLDDLDTEKGKIDAILSSMNEGLLAFNDRFEVVIMNQAASILLRTAAGDSIGENIDDIVRIYKGEKRVNKTNSPIHLAIDHGVYNARIVDDYYVEDSEGHIFPVVMSVAILHGDDYIEGLKGVVMFKDMTLDKEIDKAKTEFVSLASHQLRTPLSSINWYAEMLLAGDVGKLTDEQADYVKQIYSGNQRMVDLVNSLLDVSRLELGTFSIEPVEVDIIELAKQTANDLKVQLEKKNLDFNTDFDESIEKMMADPKLLQIIYLNLLTNAIKYTPAGGKITFSIKRDGEDIQIKVKDSGYGIPDDQKDKIFTKLFRADNVQEKDTDGTGLGLYIIKSIVDHVGGSIWFESQENQGTIFYVNIPSKGMKQKEGDKSLGS